MNDTNRSPAVTQRNAGLDYLRSAAILIVLANHAFLTLYVGTARVKFEGFAAAVSACAVIAIEWLFVLSGFLIGAMMIRSFERGGSWWNSARDFWLRRWFRTLPNYWLFVGINALLVSVGLATGKFEFSFVFFSQNLAWAEAAPHFFGESWSLALDEWFYLVMPLLIGLFFLAKASTRAAFFLSASALILLPTLARMFQHPVQDIFVWDAQIRRVTVFHLDATGWGVMAAALNRWHHEWWRSGQIGKLALGLMLMASGLFLVVSLLSPEASSYALLWVTWSLAITLQAFGTLLCLPWLTGLRQQPSVTTRLVERISLYSYSIYLVHFPMLFLVIHAFELGVQTNSSVLFAVMGLWLVCTLVVSALINVTFEQPISNLRERFTQRSDASPF